MLFFILFLNTASPLPSNCPQPPPHYGPWMGSGPNYEPVPVDSFLNRKFQGTDHWSGGSYFSTKLDEDTQLPYKIKAKRVKGFLSFWGSADFYDDDSSFGHTDYDFKRCSHIDISIRWYPHQDIELTPYRLLAKLIPLPSVLPSFARVALDTAHVDTITISGTEAYRVRGWWSHGGGDSGCQEVGEFTSYYIQTDDLDFEIVCLSCFYIHECYLGNPEYAAKIDEECPPLEVISKTDRLYPNRIRELERAVERTFRVK